MAKDFPDKHMLNTQQSTTLFLRCVEAGYDMFGCANDYPLDGVKGCAKQRSATTMTLCYKCGEEGHFARGCTNNAKSVWFKGECSAHSRKKDGWKNDSDPRSAPPDTYKRKRP